MSTTSIRFKIQYLVDVPKDLVPTDESLADMLNALSTKGEVNSYSEEKNLWRVYMTVSTEGEMPIPQIDDIVDAIEAEGLHVADIDIAEAAIVRGDVVV